MPLQLPLCGVLLLAALAGGTGEGASQASHFGELGAFTRVQEAQAQALGAGVRGARVGPPAEASLCSSGSRSSTIAASLRPDSALRPCSTCSSSLFSASSWARAREKGDAALAAPLPALALALALALERWQEGHWGPLLGPHCPSLPGMRTLPSMREQYMTPEVVLGVMGWPSSFMCRDRRGRGGGGVGGRERAGEGGAPPPVPLTPLSLLAKLLMPSASGCSCSG